MKLKIIDMDHMGSGIAKDNNKVIFIPKSVPDDICEVEIIKDNQKYAKGKITSIIEPSSLRKKALCPYYKECGGCNISNLDYQEQLAFKESKVKNIFKKYLNLDINPTVIKSNKQYTYRNKITYHYDKVLGLISEYDGLVNIDSCLLVSDNINNLFNEIKKNDLSKVKLITIKECDNGLILSITGSMLIDNLKDKCLSIYLNNKCVYYKEDGYIYLDNLKYMISNQSFFQVNTSNITNLYNEIIKYGNFVKTDKVIDLYCGVGSITLYISKYVKEVLGIEIVEDAIKDAKVNANINKINNVKFICGDVSKLIDDNLKGNILIVDPPRTGLDKHTIEVINKKKITKVIYVSCNPMTLVRDLKLLTNYELENISIVDMFPQTHHVECVCSLSIKII